MRHRDLWTASLLGFVAGYTTSNTKVRFDTFGGMMTGNTVKLGISIAQGQWAWTGVFAACIACFALGTFAALFMIKRIEARRGQHLFLLARAQRPIQLTYDPGTENHVGASRGVAATRLHGLSTS